MSSLPLHPAVVHLPVALALLMPVVALLMPVVALAMLVAWRKAWLPARTWWLVAALQLVLVVAAITVLNTGEREEERVERVVGESALHAHEQAAQLFTGVSVGCTLAGTRRGRRALRRRRGARTTARAESFPFRR